MYNFPRIRHINDVLWAIKGDPDFIVADKGDYKVINYVVVTPTTFPRMNSENDEMGALRRECRGLIFDKNGVILRRAYHKFFNLGEREEVSDKVKLELFERPHRFLQKLDGSMITPIFLNGRFRLTTKMGITDTSNQAEHAMVTSRLGPLWHNFMNFFQDCEDSDITPIFEWCSPDNRIVVPYKDNRLILTGMRWRTSGEYMSYPALVRQAKAYGLDIVEEENTPEVLDIAYDQENCEGWVVRFENGHMVKIKTFWYVRLHKAKDALSSEKNVLALVLNNQIDDLMPFMMEDDKNRLLDYAAEIMRGVSTVTNTLVEDIMTIRRNGTERKNFALTVAKLLPPHHASIIFRFAWDPNLVPARIHDAVEQEILSIILRNTGTKTKVESIRHLMNGAKWNYEVDQADVG